MVLDRHRDQVLAAVRRHGGSDVRVFGSVARGTDTVGSDVDLLVVMPPSTALWDVVALEQELEGLLGVHVDVVTDGRRSRVLDRARAEGLALLET